MAVRSVVSGADGGVLIIVMLPALVVGASVVHPVRQVSLQPLERDGETVVKDCSRLITAQIQSATDNLHLCYRLM